MTIKAEIFQKAADQIAQHGLIKGAYMASHSEACCTLGAIRYVRRGDRHIYGMSMRAYEEALADLIDPDWRKAKDHHDAFGVVADWNDHPQRTQDEVVDLLTRAAAVAAAQELE